MRAAAFILIFTLAIATASASAQQGGATRFVYDDNGRLRAVVSPTGEAAIYEYDAAGNFTRVRVLASSALELLDFFPKQGVPGDVVTFIGVGFGAGVDSVSFNGAAAQVLETNNTTVMARVPQAATTGPVTINTPRGAVVTAVPFTIKGVRVDPSTASIFPLDTVQLAAVVAVAGPDQTVTWSVNEIDGGNASVGTISASGLYTAPGQPGIFIARATSNADPLLFGESVVTVKDRSLINTVVAPSVSVRRGPPPGFTTGAALSVRRGSPPSITTGAGVSVQRGLPPGIISGPGVSVQRGNPPGIVTGANVSVTNGPHISSISPGTFTRGATIAVTINGVNFAGATSISFFTVAGVLDSTITFSGLNVNGSGTVFTASVTVSGSAALGRRIVVISGPAGSSQVADLGVNTIEIVP